MADYHILRAAKIDMLIASSSPELSCFLASQYLASLGTCGQETETAVNIVAREKGARGLVKTCNGSSQ